MNGPADQGSTCSGAARPGSSAIARVRGGAGHHRLPFPDLLIAAIADRHRCAVRHYDTDYDVLRERTDLRFDSEWLAERGSL